MLNAIYQCLIGLNIMGHFSWLFSKSGGPWGGGGDDHNEPQNPWSRRQGNNQNDLDDAIERMQEKFKKVFNQGGGGRDNGSLNPRFIGVGVAALLGLWLLTGFFRVQEGELGVVLRFGKEVRLSSPGLRYHLPNPIEQVLIQKVAAVNTIDGGMRAEKNGDASEQSYILTGDENMVHTNYTVLWKIKDISEFLFTARHPEATIKIAAESVIREIIGKTTARSALTEGRDSIGTQAQALLQKLLDSYKMGVQVISVQLQNVAPPREVVESFYDVQASLVDADRARNEAEAYRNDIIPRARGSAIQVIQEAEAYKESKVAGASGEASRFKLLADSFKSNRSVAMKRYYLESMEEILPNINKVVLDGKSTQGVLPYFPLPEMAQKSVSKENSN